MTCTNNSCVFCIYFVMLGMTINKKVPEIIGYCNKNNSPYDGKNARKLYIVSGSGNSCDKFKCRVCLEEEWLL